MNYKEYSCKIEQGYVLKYLAELLKINKINEIGFYFEETGFSIKEDDPSNIKRIETFFYRECFLYYNFPTKKYIKICTDSICSHLKNIKKKDILEIFIEPDEMYMGFKIFSNDNNMIVKNSISKLRYYAIENNGHFIRDDEYSYPINIPNSEFQKNIKLFQNICPRIEITIQDDKYLCFEANKSELSTNKTEFGVLDESKPYYKKLFDVVNFFKIIKICSVCKTIKFSYSNIPNYPLKMKADISHLGFINIYLKDDELIEFQKEY